MQFRQGNQAGGYAKYQELVEKDYASSRYRNVKEQLKAEVSRRIRLLLSAVANARPLNSSTKTIVLTRRAATGRSQPLRTFADCVAHPFGVRIPCQTIKAGHIDAKYLRIRLQVKTPTPPISPSTREAGSGTAAVAAVIP